MKLLNRIAYNFLYPILLMQLLFVFPSCINYKKMVYFNNDKDTTLHSIPPIPDPIIQNNDILGITISSLNPEASLIFNTHNITSGGAPSGYLVNTDGQILLPVLGNIKAAGLTKNQLQAYITKTLIDKKLLVDPIVNIQFMNFKVTILGEVGHPTVLSVPSEKISLLEAIGLAGDLTMSAQRDNILIIREENGQRKMKYINLNTNEIFTSPYYYLKSNDIIYVEPNKAKIASASSRTPQWFSIGLTSITVILGIVSLIK